MGYNLTLWGRMLETLIVSNMVNRFGVYRGTKCKC
jgi:hypothetical protein